MVLYARNLAQETRYQILPAPGMREMATTESAIGVLLMTVDGGIDALISS